jgi:hypothetical protein
VVLVVVLTDLILLELETLELIHRSKDMLVVKERALEAEVEAVVQLELAQTEPEPTSVETVELQTAHSPLGQVLQLQVFLELMLAVAVEVQVAQL